MESVRVRQTSAHFHFQKLGSFSEITFPFPYNLLVVQMFFHHWLTVVFLHIFFSSYFLFLSSLVDRWQRSEGAKGQAGQVS